MPAVCSEKTVMDVIVPHTIGKPNLLSAGKPACLLREQKNTSSLNAITSLTVTQTGACASRHVFSHMLLSMQRFLVRLHALSFSAGMHILLQ